MRRTLCGGKPYIWQARVERFVFLDIARVQLEQNLAFMWGANRFSDTRNRANLATDESNYVEWACMFGVFLFWSGSRFLQSCSIWKVKCEKWASQQQSFYFQRFVWCCWNGSSISKQIESDCISLWAIGEYVFWSLKSFLMANNLSLKGLQFVCSNANRERERTPILNQVDASIPRW